MDDQTQMHFVVRDVVQTGLQASTEDRLMAAAEAIRDRVPPHQIEEFWVALIESSVSTIRTFLAVCGDEITPSSRPVSTEGAGSSTGMPIQLVNDALAHASAGDSEAVADVLRLIDVLDTDQRAIALSNIIQVALAVGDILRAHDCVGPPTE